VARARRADLAHQLVEAVKDVPDQAGQRLLEQAGGGLQRQTGLRDRFMAAMARSVLMVTLRVA
jgi:hypothetical protein